MMGYGAGLGFGLGGPLALLGFVLLVVGIVVLIVWAIGRAGHGAATQGQAPQPAADDAVEELRVRFARGEMTADEFVAAKQTLEAQR